MNKTSNNDEMNMSVEDRLYALETELTGDKRKHRKEVGGLKSEIGGLKSEIGDLKSEVAITELTIRHNEIIRLIGENVNLRHKNLEFRKFFNFSYR